MQTTIKSLKLSDTDPEISKFGRVSEYWINKGFRVFSSRVRPGLRIPQGRSILDIQERILKLYHIKALEFGNWLTMEDRVNYVACLYFAMYDLNKILHFNGNIGFDTVGIAFGARGSGHALAHFEPGEWIINITRYDKEVRDREKPDFFVKTGGMAALAHEYGHALDYFFGSYIEQHTEYRSLTYGRTYSFQFTNRWPVGSLRHLAVEIVRQAVQGDKKGQSTWYRRMLANESTNTEYFRRHNEIFARLFEQYIRHKLQEIGVTNRLLSQTKYESSAYMKPAELKQIIPLFDQLTKKMAAIVSR